MGTFVTAGHAIPSGWFPDPTGRHEARFWDGAAWTDHIADGGVTGVDPPTPAPCTLATAVSTDGQRSPDRTRTRPAGERASSMNPTNPQVIRKDSAFLWGDGKPQSGTLLLFPDRLVHVASNAYSFGLAGGVILAAALLGYGVISGGLGGGLGVGVALQVAKGRAVTRAVQGGKGVLEIPFSQVIGVHRGKQGLNRKVLEVRTIGGATVKFGVKFQEWAPALAQCVPNDVLTLEESTSRT